MLEPIHVSKSTPYQTEVEFTKILSSLSTIEKRAFIDRLSLYLKMNNENYTKVLSVEDLEFFSKNPLIEFGSHSHSHPILTNISQDDLENELKSSKLNLEKIIGSPITILAYPNGISNENVKTTALNYGYKYLLHSNNTINRIQNNTIDFDRINQYHTNFELGVANMFGILARIKKIIAK
jgi:peptidoglycan/xylan/chitin deacetylase (PgdA/CDA1 family)